MLTLTDNAASIVKEITAQPEVGGLRISSEEGGGEPAFAVATAPAPADADQVVEQDGAAVYLDADAATQLDDKVLDASVDEEGNLQFALGHQH